MPADFSLFSIFQNDFRHNDQSSFIVPMPCYVHFSFWSHVSYFSQKDLSLSQVNAYAWPSSSTIGSLFPGVPSDQYLYQAVFVTLYFNSVH